jgi:hypothetical protein
MHPTILSRRYAPGKACSRLTSHFRVAFYCRRVDLVCVYARRPRRTRRSHHCQRASRKLSVHAVVLFASCTPLYCPGATRPRQVCSQSSYLTLSGCQLLLQGGPGVRLARHRRRRQELRRQRCTARRIGGGDKNCDDNNAQPGASAAATSTATTTMHSTTALHTAGVAATCATLVRSSTRTT